MNNIYLFIFLCIKIRDLFLIKKKKSFILFVVKKNILRFKNYNLFFYLFIQSNTMLKSFLCYLICLLFIGLVHSQQYPYRGSQCADVYNFTFNHPYAGHIIDTSVYAYMGRTFNSAPYIETACVKRLRKHFCMLSLVYNNSILTTTGMVYCQPECKSLANSECSSLFEILPEEPKKAFLSPCDFLSMSQPPYCYDGSLSTFTETVTYLLIILTIFQ